MIFLRRIGNGFEKSISPCVVLGAIQVGARKVMNLEIVDVAFEKVAISAENQNFVDLGVCRSAPRHHKLGGVSSRWWGFAPKSKTPSLMLLCANGTQ